MQLTFSLESAIRVALTVVAFVLVTKFVVAVVTVGHISGRRLRPHTTSLAPRFFLGGGEPRRSTDFAVELLRPFALVHGDALPVTQVAADYRGPCLVDYTPNRALGEVVIHIPVSFLVLHLPYRSLLTLAHAHKVVITRQSRSLSTVVALLQAHICNAACTSYHSLCVVPVNTPHSTPPPSRHVPVQTVFPPSPPDRIRQADLVRSWCAASHASELDEDVCAVCGELVPVKNLSAVPANSLDLSCLTRTDEAVTRTERSSHNDPVSEIAGPVLCPAGLYTSRGVPFMHMCTTCLNVVKRNRLPRRALANGLWLGEIPDVLQALNFVEKLLVARYRHNYFVVRVDHGQRKLAANAVVFPQPIARVYTELPPLRSEMDEILAILFCGPVQPSRTEYRRTPFLVRHNVVMHALLWLQLNHSDYSDISISPANLATYPEDCLPVCIVHKPTDGSPGVENVAVHDLDPEKGTEDGQCSFAVHGLTGDQLVGMSAAARIATAIQYFDSGANMLGFTHGKDPASTYHNPRLYPGMFPWLFPYGQGGFENGLVSTKLHRSDHIRHLLMYGDRRFQVDEHFAYIVFNQEQIRASTHGGFLLTERRNFPQVVERILSVDQAALNALVERSKGGTYVTPETPEEKQCFELISYLDHVAGHVQGSNTLRKYQQSEINSLIIAIGVPVFFITFAPTDFKHPVCLYFCGENIDLTSSVPDLPSSSARMRAIARNPVACARFFDFIVRSFIRHILRAGSDQEGDGLFGPTEAYYAPVESQGRLTLHLHMLLWIKSCLSPQVIRQRLLEDNTFRLRLIDWLEECHRGDFNTGPMAHVSQRCADATAASKLPEGADGFTQYRDPTTTLPTSPPRFDSTATLDAWYQSVCEVVDDIVYRSNRHSEEHDRGCMRGKEPNRYCRARFPHETFASTMVDPSTGAIRFKKTEDMINTFNNIVSYVLRCNSDVTCLLSGTQVRAVMAYMSDYVTKSSLNAHSIFAAVQSVLEHRAKIIDNSVGRPDAARTLITKMVNAVTAKQQTGGPALCAYLLGFPDHYTDREFKVFFWHSYVKTVSQTCGLPSPAMVSDESDKVVVGKSGDSVVALSKVNDYIFRPREFDSLSLFDFLTATVVRKIRASSPLPQRDNSSNPAALELDDNEEEVADEIEDLPPCNDPFSFLPGHPWERSHFVYRLRDDKRYVLNFAGGVLPRRVNGDQEEYCKTMLTFFLPWRAGRDLLGNASKWEDAFDGAVFTSAHLQIMNNMNVLYECLDARDDYSAQRRADNASGGSAVPQSDVLRVHLKNKSACREPAKKACGTNG